MQSLINPQTPRLCPDGYTKYPPTPCYPFHWMKDNMQAGTITDIDGFTIDENKEKVTGLIQKREYHVADYNLVVDGKEVRDVILHREEEKEWKLRHKISSILDVPFYLALWPVDYPLKKADALIKPVIVFNIALKNDVLNFSTEFLGDTNELTKFIRKLRNGRSFGSIKKLNVATTMMECYLATKTNDPWPGNLDAAIWNKEKEVITAIIEFKTHNYPQYPISSQYFGQWEGDERRYRALHIMQKHLAIVSSKPKFIYAIWGTDKSHKEIKLQTIDNLKPKDDKYVKRPVFTDATTKDFTREVLCYI